MKSGKLTHFYISMPTSDEEVLPNLRDRKRYNSGRENCDIAEERRGQERLRE
jgi:hypothetical protein